MEPVLEKAFFDGAKNFFLVLALSAAWLGAPCRAAGTDLPQLQAKLQDELFGRAVVQEARKYIGRPYVWGGKSPKGFDCAGYTQYVFHCFGIELPKRAIDQFLCGDPIELPALMPGDLVFFTSPSAEASLHVGIYEGHEQFLHAPASGSRIKSSNFNSLFFAARYLGARRLRPPKKILGSRLRIQSSKP